MIVLGLDLSLVGTGLCVLGPDGSVLYKGTVGYPLKRGAPVRDRVERMQAIASEAVRVSLLFSVDSVVVEGYAWGATGRQQDLAELRGVVLRDLWYRAKREPDTVPAPKARKVVLGKGRLGKGEIVSLLRERGLWFKDHNVADAYVIAEYWRRENGERS